MMQVQTNSTADQNEPETTEPAEHKFWCCRCTRNMINDVGRINNNNSSLSNGVVVTRQPLPSNQSNCCRNNLSSIPNHNFEIKNGFNERTYELDDDSAMTISMKRLKEESTNITSAVLDNFISELKDVEAAEEPTMNDEKVMKKLPQKQVSTGNEQKMEDVVLWDINEENLWKLIPSNEQQITRIGGDQIAHDNFNDTVNNDGKEEFNEMSDISDNFSISEQTSELKSFQGNSNQIKQSKIKRNKVGLMMKVSEANDSEDVGNFSNSKINLTSSTNRKLSTDTNESDHLSMICIPDDDLILKKESAQKVNIWLGVERKNTLKSEHNTEIFVQSNKMYVNDVSNSSSSDSDKVCEIIKSTKNPEKTCNILKESGKIDISIRKLVRNTNDENASRDDGLRNKRKNLPKNANNIVQLFTDDTLSE